MYLQSGVWEMQSHGDQAGVRIPINSEGRTELFLVSRQWLAEQNRLENEEEWLRRLEEDYRNAADKIEQKLGVRPVAFAWPEGNFGQEGIPNAPYLTERNLELVRQYYALAFHQDESGWNLRTRDPHDYARGTSRPTGQARIPAPPVGPTSPRLGGPGAPETIRMEIAIADR